MRFEQAFQPRRSLPKVVLLRQPRRASFSSCGRRFGQRRKARRASGAFDPVGEVGDLRQVAVLLGVANARQLLLEPAANSSTISQNSGSSSGSVERTDVVRRLAGAAAIGLAATGRAATGLTATGGTGWSRRRSHADHGPQEFAGVDRLGQIAGAAGFEALFPSPFMAWAVRAMIGVVKPRRAQFARRGVAVHHGHLHVHEDQSRTARVPRASTPTCPFSAR